MKWVYVPCRAIALSLQFCIPVLWCQAQQSWQKGFLAWEGCCMGYHFLSQPVCLFICLQNQGKAVASHSLPFTSLDSLSCQYLLKSFSKMHSLCLLPLCPQNFPMYLLRVMNFYLSVGLWPVLGKNYFGASETCLSWMQVTKAIENVTAVENCLFWLSKRLSSEIQDLLGQSPKNSTWLIRWQKRFTVLTTLTINFQVSGYVLG